MIQKKEIQNITNLLNNTVCKCGKSNNAKPFVEPENSESRTKSENLHFKQIGTIFSSFPEKRGTPRQPLICASTNAKLKLHNSVFTNPKHAIEGLESFSHMWYVLLKIHTHNN